MDFLFADSDLVLVVVAFFTVVALAVVFVVFAFALVFFLAVFLTSNGSTVCSSGSIEVLLVISVFVCAGATWIPVASTIWPSSSANGFDSSITVGLNLERGIDFPIASSLSTLNPKKVSESSFFSSTFSTSSCSASNLEPSNGTIYPFLIHILISLLHSLH